MKSSLFSNFRIFLGSLLLGIVSFYVFSVVILDQIKDLFNVSFSSAYYIFAILYFITPVVFIFIWFLIYKSFNYLKITKLVYKIIYLSALLIFVISSLFLIFTKNDALHYPIGYIIFFASFLIFFFFRIVTRPIIKAARKAKIEFIFSFSIIAILSTIYFCRNFENVDFNNEKTFVLNSFETKDSIEHLKKTIIQSQKILEGQQVINSIKPDANPNVITKIGALITDREIPLSPFQKKLIKKEYELFHKLDSLLARFENDTIDISEINSIITSKIDSLIINDSMFMLVDSLNDIAGTYLPVFLEIADYQSNKFNEHLAKKWKSQINLLTYRGLLSLVTALLSMLCIHFYLVILKEEDLLEHENLKDEIERMDDGKFQVNKKNEFKESPEFQITSSGIILLILLIIPILKPAKKENINLDKPFISFKLFQEFGSEQGATTYITNNYYIDSVINKTIPDKVVVDFDSFIMDAKDKNIQIGPTNLDGLTTTSNRINDNLIHFSNSFGANYNGQTQEGAPVLIKKHKDKIDTTLINKDTTLKK